MAGRPVLSGAVQLTSRLSDVPAVALTVGASGASGGSATSVRLTVTATVSVSVPSETLIVTEYEESASKS